MSRLRPRWLAGGALLAAAVLLMYAPADPEAMRARGLARLLELEHARRDDDPASLFARLDAAVARAAQVTAGDAAVAGGDRASAPADVIPVAVRIAGSAGSPRLRPPISEPASGADALRLALDAQLEVHNASRRERGLAPLALEDPQAPVAVRIDLELRESASGMSLAAAMSGPGMPRERIEAPQTWLPPSPASLLPPLIAIGVALLVQRAAIALLCGVCVGALWLRIETGGGPLAWLAAATDVVTVYLRHALVDELRAELLAFVVVLGVMVGLLRDMGAIDAVIVRVGSVARTARQGALATFAAGLLIFFDDYCNCILVGNVMRPLLDRLRVAREKLAFIVDSTAAPVAGLSLVSTWIAFEVSIYAPQLPGVGIVDSAYSVFVQSLPFRYYSLFTLLFVALNVVSQRDFGPMRAAERAARVRAPGQEVEAGDAGSRAGAMQHIARVETATPPARARHAVAAIGAVLGVSLEEIFRRGGGVAWLQGEGAGGWNLAALAQIVADGGGSTPLLWGALAGLGVTLWCAASTRVRVALAAGAATCAWLGLASRGIASAGLALGGIATIAAAAVAFQRLRGRGAPARLGARAVVAGAGDGARRLAGPLAILIGAWMLARVCDDARTADQLVALASEAIGPVGLPIALFTMAAGVSFATGTSWGTMSILLPNVVPLAAIVGVGHPLGSEGMVLVSIGAVLEGAIFGDHCSPISDTTVLSSVASGCDHLAHVRTQLPYALVVAVTAVVCGYLPALLVPAWPVLGALAAAAVALGGLLLLLGRPTEGEVTAPAASALRVPL